MKLILGSQSPRRRELLKQVGLDFEVRTADLDETEYETGDPARTVCAICEAKARAVAKLLKTEADACHLSPVTCHLILTSDTIVVLDGRIMGKPHSQAQAEEMLSALSGREHSVFTAFTLLPVGGAETPVTEFEEPRVRFRPLEREEILAYIASGEPMDKAGAYGIQGLGAALVESIRGDFYTVMGLPLCRVCEALKRYGIRVLR